MVKRYGNIGVRLGAASPRGLRALPCEAGRRLSRP